jgi:replicative DNA helicase
MEQRSETAELFSNESERAVLGVVMTTSSVEGVGAARLLLEREQLAAGDFHVLAHVAAYAAAQGLLGASAPADPVSMFEKLRGNAAVQQAGGLPWLLKIFEEAEKVLMVPEAFAGFARQVREMALRRQLVAQAREQVLMAMDPGADLALVLARANARLASIVFRRDTFVSLAEVATQVERELVKLNDGGPTRLLPTGIRLLDTLIGGLPPLLVVVGGRPGAGKSAVAATLVQSLALSGTKVGVFSLEDRAPWLLYRLLSGNSAVPNQKLRFEKLSGDEWVRAGEGFARISRFSDNVLIDDRRRMTATDVVQSARNMVVNHGVRAILIDHLLEVKPRERYQNRAHEVQDTLGAFRDLANEYELPVVVFTQLNRGSEAKKEPTLTDFKDAGAVEEMARVAIAIVRDGDTIGLCVIKNTNGGLGRVDVEFLGSAAMVATTERQKDWTTHE